MDSHHTVKMGSDRSFGLVVGGILALIGLWPAFWGGSPRIILTIVGAALVVMALVRADALRPLNKLWFKLGILLGAVVAPVVMGLVFYLAVTPIGVLMRVFGADLLDTKMAGTRKTYWIDRAEPTGSMRDQF